MLFKTNILALVGTEENVKFPNTKVIIWDDCKGKADLELAFKSPIRSTRIRKDIIAIAIDDSVFVYALIDYKLVDIIDTCLNPKGVLALSYAHESKVIACPHTEEGKVRVKLYG